MAAGEAGEGEGGLGYWLRWQVFVCALIIYAPAAAAAVLLPKVKSQRPLRAADLWVPCWCGVHPLWLLGFRALAVVVMTVFLSRMVLSGGISSLFFYTQWTFALVIVYFMIATLISARGCWVYSKQCFDENEEASRFLDGDLEQNTPAALISRENKNGHEDSSQSPHKQIVNEKSAGFWGYLMQIIYQTSAGAVIVTDLVYWGLLVPFFYSDTFSLDMIKDGMHSLNALFLLGDTAINSMSFPWFRMAYLVFWSAAYITFQWILHACGVSWWPYPFLELATPWAPLWYFSMALAHIPCYTAYWLIVKGKIATCGRFFSHAFMMS